MSTCQGRCGCCFVGLRKHRRIAGAACFGHGSTPAIPQSNQISPRACDSNGGARDSEQRACEVERGAREDAIASATPGVGGGKAEDYALQKVQITSFIAKFPDIKKLERKKCKMLLTMVLSSRSLW
jgi:hypothetical protein